MESKTQPQKEVDALEYLSKTNPKHAETADTLQKNDIDLELMNFLMRDGFVESNGIKYWITQDGKQYLLQNKINKNLEEGGKINQRMEIFTAILILIGIIQFISSFLTIKKTEVNTFSYHLFIAMSLFTFAGIMWAAYKIKVNKL